MVSNCLFNQLIIVLSYLILLQIRKIGTVSSQQKLKSENAGNLKTIDKTVQTRMKLYC